MDDGRAASAEAEPLLSIGELAALTGVHSSTLRSWEKRVGFPTAVRTPGGQRRYRADDASRVARMLAERERGLTLAAAVLAVERGIEIGVHSVFARLRQAHPHVETMNLDARVMRALTWAMEDECLAYASRPLLFGCFQDERSFMVAGQRWHELARSARLAVAMSDFDHTSTQSAPVRVALPAGSPMLNEWSIVCLDPQMSMALVGWELPRSRDEPASRRLDALLTLEPAVVRDAGRLCAEVAAANGFPRALEGVAENGPDLAPDPRRFTSLLRRFARYVDAPSAKA